MHADVVEPTYLPFCTKFFCFTMKKISIPCTHVNLFDFVLFSSVWINSWLPNEPNMPHESWKQSGLGRTGGAYSIDFYTELKTVSITF